jgi:hypothetical protein
MTRYPSDAVRELQPLATGPTIKATHNQTCGWCQGEVATKEPVTYTRESGWCHQSCTTTEAAETRL